MNTTRRPDSTQLRRQWALLRLLASSGREFTVKELADQLDSTKSTIQRDLATLEQDFALIEERVGAQKKTYRIDEKIRALEAINFGTAELLALHAASSALASLSTTPLHDDLTSVVRKLRGFLSPRHNGGLDAIARVFHAHPRGFIGYEEHGEVIDDLSSAIAKRQYCHIRYYSAWNKTTKNHRIRPLKLMWHKSALYLLGLIDGKTEITTFSVQRIQNIETEIETFPAPRVDVEEHTRKAFGVWVSDDEEDVEIIFSKEMAWRIEERTFHPDETKERLDDGRLRYSLRTSAQWEIIPWVLSFGANAELVGPAAWRGAVLNTLQDSATKYLDPVSE
tara:strand:+ start:39444 stop:40451 length:1008 start_codon:yes stop_codon:yes gene_type:complete